MQAYKKFYNYSIRRWPNKEDAEDFASYAYQKCLERGVENVRARTLYVDYLRDKYVDLRTVPEGVRLIPLDKIDESKVSSLDDFASFMRFQDILSLLAPKERAILILHYFYGLKLKEIGFLFATSTGEATFELYKIRQKLKDKITKGQAGGL